MKTYYFLPFFIFLSLSLFGQHQIKLSEPATIFRKVNDNGDITNSFRIYNFETEAIQEFPDVTVFEIDAINNQGDMAGSLLVGEGANLSQRAAYKLANENDWQIVPFVFSGEPAQGVSSTAFGLSNNGIWITGATPKTPTDFEAFAYRYNTQTGVMEVVSSTPNSLISVGRDISDDGQAFGAFDLDGTFGRRPAIFDVNNPVFLIGDGVGEVFGATADGVTLVGSLGNEGFIYNTQTQDLTTFQSPIQDFPNVGFQDISENGWVVGYAENPPDTQQDPRIRQVLVYHPQYTNGALVPLPDVIAESIPTPPVDEFPDGNMGTALGVSPNGVYFTGVSNNNPFSGGRSWAVKLDYELLSTQNFQESKNEITFYPNPTKDKLFLRTSALNAKVSFYSSTGQLLVQDVFTNISGQVSLTHLLAGIKGSNQVIFAKVETKGKTTVKKLLVE